MKTSEPCLKVGLLAVLTTLRSSLLAVDAVDVQHRVPATATFRLFQKSHPAGKVRLGGNDAGKTGALLNCFVIVR
jgi:hypothetical protein